jgi:F-type H+-transporting ATPase subunit delta
MSLETVAARYAHALLEIGAETGSLQQISDQVSDLALAYTSSPELKTVLESPLVSHSDRTAVIAELGARMGCSQVVKNMIGLLVERRRMAILPAMARALRSLSDERAGLVRAQVSSAKALPEDYVRRLQGELEKMTGRKVVLERKVDPSLIGGVVTRVGDLVIDGSIRTRLADLKSQLLSS